MLTNFQLAYGRTRVEAALEPEHNAEILSPPFPKSAAGAEGLIRKSLRNPVQFPPLENLVKRGEKIAIIVSDTTRASASELILPVMLDEMNAAGVHDEDIDIIVALGIHRRQTPEEHRALVGDSVFERIRIQDHDAYSDDLVHLGSTSRGTPVAINKIVADADKVILTGAVVPHYFAGFGGGRKSIMPGICSHEASMQSHFLVFNPEGGRNEHAATARLAGNPVHEDMLEAAEMAAPDFVVNAVLTPEKKLCAVFCGDLRAAHREACQYYLEHFSVIKQAAADLTIVSCGGFPKDINFIQAHKAIDSAFSVTRPGGWMIVMAECRDGFGFPGFIDWFRYNSKREFEGALREDYQIYGQTAYATYEKATSVNIILVSNLAPHDVERMQIYPADSFEKALALAVLHLGKEFRTYVIPASSASIFQTEAEHARALASITKYTNGKEENQKVS